MTARDDQAGRWLRRGLALSLLLHVVIGSIAHLSLAPAPVIAPGEPDSVDIEIAPAAPAAEVLPDEVPLPPPPEPRAAEPAVPVPEPEPEPEPEKEPETAIAVLDAGVDDAERVAIADAGVDDAGMVATADGGAGDGDAGGALALGDGGGPGDGAVAAADLDGGVPSVTGLLDGDAGPALAVLGDGGVAGDGGLVAAGGDGGAGQADPSVTGASGGAVSPGTAADLLGYFPPGHVVSVLLRLDRVRGTEWAAAAEKVLAPMPDYQALVGDREVRIADLFETLVVSSSNPRRVDATTLVARTSMAPPALRSFLDQPGAPVAWSVAQGGMLGRRGASPRLFPGDQRVFLSPSPGWLVLAQPGDLGALTGAAAGDLDAARAAPGSLPPWLERVQTIEAEAGVEDGPAIVVTIGTPGRRYRLPELGLGVSSVPAPERATLALTVEKRGFVVRGNLRFTSDDAATEFVTSAESLRAKVLELRVFSAVLRKARVYNAVKGASFTRTGARVSYATSISIADARVLVSYVAQVVSDFYGTPVAPSPTPKPTPKRRD